VTGQLSNSSQPLLSQVFTSLHEADHPGKAVEARPLHRPQRIRLEERHHSFGQLLDPPDAELHTITVIDSDLAATEERSKLLEEGNISLMLHHAELWKDLPANLHRRLPVDADEETSLPIDKTDDPIGTQAFLLVVCTDRIVTHFRVPSDTPGFPAYSQMHSPSLLAAGASELTLGPFSLLLPSFHGGALISVALCMSPCRSDHIIPRVIRGSGVWSLRIPEPTRPWPFLLIARTSRIVTAADVAASTGGSTGCSSK
jgi:hypothetical protein